MQKSQVGALDELKWLEKFEYLGSALSKYDVVDIKIEYMRQENYWSSKESKKGKSCPKWRGLLLEVVFLINVF